MSRDKLSLSRRRLFGAAAGVTTLSVTSYCNVIAASDQASIEFTREALRMRDVAIARGDQPYGAIIVRDNEVVGRGVSAVVTSNDPTAHAEMLAIRAACEHLKTRDLSDCVMYGSARACAMCEAAAYWARISTMYFGAQAHHAGAPHYRNCSQ